MPKYIPLVFEPNIKASLSDLLEFHWQLNAITASFVIPERPSEAIQVAFLGQCIVRIVDEFPLSTEVDDSPSEGLVPDHFAYRVEDALFFRVQSEAFRETVRAAGGQCKHYRLITGWTCLDVVTAAEPRFSIVARAESSD